MQRAKVPVAEAKLWGGAEMHKTWVLAPLWPEKLQPPGEVTLTIPASIAGSLQQTVIDDPLGRFQLSNNMTLSITVIGEED